MSLSFKNIQSIIIVLLIASLFFVSRCTPSLNCDECADKIVTVTETKWDTVVIKKTDYVPQWQDRIITEFVEVTEPIDTLAVLKDYYAKYFYSDVVELDSLGFITINDTVSRNKIMSRSVISSLNIPTTTITHTKYLNYPEFYYGVSLTGSRNGLNYIGPEFLYKTKKKNIFGLGVGTDQDLNLLISAKMFWKFKKKK